MTIRKITIVEPQITRITLGRLTALCRPAAGELAALEAGDLLWVREPFRFKAKYDDFKPTDCVELDQLPHFTGGMAESEIPRLNLGKPRPARNLPKSCHRQHLEVTGVTPRPLQTMTGAEAKAEGFEGLAQWIDAWDRNISGYYSSGKVKWDDNPEVLFITFIRHNRPAPADAAAEAEAGKAKGGEDAD